MGKASKENVAAIFKVKWWYLTGRLETSLSGLPVSGPILKNRDPYIRMRGARRLTQMFGTKNN